MNRRDLLVCALPAAPAWASGRRNAWPARAIRLMVAYPPGGVSDDVARALADVLDRRLNVPVVVENRPGAGGGVAMDLLARSAPDGHTLCFSAISPLSLLPHLGPVHYDPVHGIAPVASVMFTPVLVVGTTALPAENFGQMLEAARARPGSVRWATSGVGTTGHLVLELVRRLAHVDITHIPYKGGGQQLNDALAGHFELLSSNVAALQLRYIRSGRFKPLAVGSPSRVPVLPDVPTLAELGFAQANLASLFGVFAPGGTPGPVLRRLNAEINAALQRDDIRQRLLAVNNVPTGGSVAAFEQLIARESEAMHRLLAGGARVPK